MNGVTSHKQGKSRTPGLGAAWAILIGMGATSITFNVVHAVHGGALNIALALVYGIAPVYGAALLSHVVAVYGGGKAMQRITFALMLGAMALSIGATATVVRPVAGVWMQWLFGVVIDGASLVSLRVILDSRRRKAAATAAVEVAQADAAQARAEAAAAEGGRSGLAEELVSVRAELGAELAAVKAELDRAREAVLRGGPGKRSSGPRKAVSTAPVDDVALEARALELLATDLDMSGAELGRRLGVTPGYGRKLRRRLTQQDRPTEAVQDRPGAAAPDGPQDRP